MFCPSNDTLQTISVKTKLLAQKCTQQIHCINPQKKDVTQASLIQNEYPGGVVVSGSATDRPTFQCFCPCKQTLDTFKTLPKKSNTKDSTTKWYVKQPTWRLWGEEREKDAIFTVYLKKVRYHRPTPIASSQDSDEDISHLEWETVRVRFVKAATLERLVDALSKDDGELESTFVNVFLATYRTFAKPEQILDLLLQRYERLHADSIHEPLAEEHKKSLVSALHVWMDGYPEDWNQQNLKKVIAFTSSRLSSSEIHYKALNRLDKLARARAAPSLPWDNNEYADYAEQFNDLCLTPAFLPPAHLLQAYRFPHIPVKHFAEQLTRMDMELFKRLIPHQCLGATWSKRERDKNEANTVIATVTQFNAVSFRVISSILIEPRLKPQERAMNIATWIDIAQELRVLKNFSSLKAIVSGLQSNAVYRLSKTWAALVREKLEIFNELARIFSEDNNACAQREVLMREGTAKFADTAGENDRHLQKVFQRQNTHISHGTIPYLGTFLTDLTMIHAAIPDSINDLINFDKKRKEFEVLAQIKLLQGAANAYHLPDDHLFDRWFASLLVLDEREAHTLSCQLEPPEQRRAQGHKKSDSIASNSSSGAGSQFYCEINTSDSRNNSLDRNATPPTASIMSEASSVSSISIESTSSGNKSNNTKTNSCKSSASQYPLINPQLVQNASVKNSASPDFYIIRVTYETDNVELDGIVLYKSIMLGNNERTPQVIRNSMMKLGLEGDPDRYTLAQVLPEKELVMPSNANVYYAVNTAFNLNFILRPKKDDNN
ncbi:ral guanine nucleotide dissociation stimulator-like 1 isoform X2 [Bradysia coprophila]|uniref:ral guanine nucleotide dissociation stimulator-like 1 isoform X2 n=1 Tax=Bradysia coprophila TaxID=38358 RepID=UPI00187DCECF|nr:ral guanine nucleotide dissociation stimulator-like 1 isoform X2 [Bradysia coprophila]